MDLIFDKINDHMDYRYGYATDKELHKNNFLEYVLNAFNDKSINCFFRWIKILI